MRNPAPPAPFDDDLDYSPQQNRRKEPQFREAYREPPPRYEQPAPRYEQPAVSQYEPPLRADFDDYKPRDTKPRRAKKQGVFAALMSRASQRPSDALFASLLACVSLGVAVNMLFLQKKEAVVAQTKAIPVVQYPQTSLNQPSFNQPTAVLPSSGFNQITTPSAKAPSGLPQRQTSALPTPLKEQKTLGDLTESVSTSKEMNKRLDQTASITMRSDPQKRVTSVQRGLNSVLDTKIQVNGTMTAETKNAIIKFEEMRRLPPKGEINERLIKELIAVKGTPLE